MCDRIGRMSVSEIKSNNKKTKNDDDNNDNG